MIPKKELSFLILMGTRKIERYAALSIQITHHHMSGAEMIDAIKNDDNRTIISEKSFQGPQKRLLMSLLSTESGKRMQLWGIKQEARSMELRAWSHHSDLTSPIQDVDLGCPGFPGRGLECR